MAKFYFLLIFICFSESFAENYVKLNENYELWWTADRGTSQIYFEVSVKTAGFIGFGISHNGAMKDADIITTGVYPDGTPYLDDRFGIGEQFPPADESNDYILISAYESDNQTHVKFKRDLNTCDPKDIPITADTMRIIWSYGPTDTVSYHGNNRGAYAVSLLDGVPPPPDLSSYETWRIKSTIEMPSADTTYWCTFNKGPMLDKKNHVAGFDAFLRNDLALQHTHHMDIYKCTAPQGENPDDYFGPLLGYGVNCENPPDNFTSARWNCLSMAFSWSIGAMVTMLPDYAGIPLDGNTNDVYYFMEVHYDNPRQLSGLTFETGMEVYYSHKIRKFDAGFATISYEATYTLMLPPNSRDIILPGHCHSECSKNIPEDGVNFFRVLLHSHMSGRKMKIRHFRNDKELPWLVNDDNFDFNYQQNKPLRPEVKIFPGDSFTIECTYDTTWKNGNATFGGLSTREEMCNGFILYYPLLESGTAFNCGSNYPSNKLLPYFGVEKLYPGNAVDPIIESPEYLKGRRLSEIIEGVNWNAAKREEYQEMIRNGFHAAFCSFNQFENVTYPSVQNEYEPIDECIL